MQEEHSQRTQQNMFRDIDEVSSISDDEDIQLFLSQSSQSQSSDASASQSASTSFGTGRGRKMARPVIIEDDDDVFSDITVLNSPFNKGCNEQPGTSTPVQCKEVHMQGQRRFCKEMMVTQKQILDVVLQNQICLKELNQRFLDKESREEIAVPSQIRYAIHEGSNKGKSRGLSWQFLEKRFTDETNDEMTDYIRTYVMGIYPEVKMAVLDAGMKRYFTSLKETFNRKRKKQDDNHRDRQRSYERKKEKSKRRKLALSSKQWSEEQKKKVLPALDMKLMSSDEEGGEGTLVSKPKQWESQQYRSIKASLDKHYMLLASDKSKRLLTKRRTGTPVPADRPNLPESLKWIFAEDD